MPKTVIAPLDGSGFALRALPVAASLADALNADLRLMDMLRQDGWSVLVRGTLHEIDPDAASIRERFDSQPWINAERDAWLLIEPFAITGRRLHAAETEWAFHVRGYL